MKSVGLFAGIGGIEKGFNTFGVESLLLCEIMPEAQSVLHSHFKKATIYNDVRSLESIPTCDILCAGFPCQNISIAGDKKGMGGSESSLVTEIFRLLKTNKPKFVVIENVANIISLHKGEILAYVTSQLSALGYNWSYRLVDPRSFGIPQRRPRFVLVASSCVSTKDILFLSGEADSSLCIDEKPISSNISDAYGFYWTEGKIGIGWANNSIPPLKCGSSLGLPSAPAIWDFNNDFFGTPSIHDAERLQGFPLDWSKPIENEGFKKSMRWKVLGNAVNGAVSKWIAERILCTKISPLNFPKHKIHKSSTWPKAAFKDIGQPMYSVDVSPYPNGIHYTPILEFLQEPLVPLSERATRGFLSRVEASTLIKYPQCFIDSLNRYLHNQYGTN